MFNKLPPGIQDIATGAHKHFSQDPAHPALENEDLYDTKKGRHRKGSRSVVITRRYRAICVVDGDTAVWYWIGSHEDYNNFTGAK